MDRRRPWGRTFLVLPLVLALGLPGSHALATDDDACDTPTHEAWPFQDPDEPHHLPGWGTATGTTEAEPEPTPEPFPEAAEDAWDAATSAANSVANAAEGDPDDWSGHAEGWLCDGERTEGDGPCPDGSDHCEAGSEVFVGGNTDTNEACSQASVSSSSGEGAHVHVKVNVEEEDVDRDADVVPGTKTECRNRGNSERVEG